MDNLCENLIFVTFLSKTWKLYIKWLLFPVLITYAPFGLTLTYGTISQGPNDLVRGQD